MPVSDLLLAGVTAFTDPVRTDGEVAALVLNKNGHLQVATKPAQYIDGKGDLAAVNEQVALDVTDCSNVVFHVKNTGSVAMAAGVFAFEGSLDSTNGTDGTWFVVQAVRSDTNTIETSRAANSINAGTGQLYAWRASVNAYKWFRIRCTTAVTASSVATWTVIRGSEATEPIPGLQTHAVTGSGTFTVAGTATTTPVAATNYGLISAATTNAAVVKASAGNLFEIAVFNPTAAIIYVKLYNKATAPTVGTDVPIISFPVAVNATVVFEFGVLGKRFAAGIAIATTAGPLATDVAAIAVNAQISATYN